ncbi:MAG: DUF1622 domain-containing protein [Bulleidia sp.]|nr:DUF1622 domain-containing protein [Bulleidia sp.]
MVETMENILVIVVDIGSICLELIGVGMMIFCASRAFIHWIRHKENPLELGAGISHSLEFLMCGEVLKTATAKGAADYIALGAIIALRFALAAEVHWEEKIKKSELKEKEDRN